MYFLQATIDSPVVFHSCGQFLTEVPWQHMQRYATSFELIFGLEGSFAIRQETERFNIGPGDALLLLADHNHVGEGLTSGRVSFYWMHFLLESTYQVLDEATAVGMIAPIASGEYACRMNKSLYLPAFSHPPQPDRIAILYRQLLDLSQTSGCAQISLRYAQSSLLMELTRQTLSGYEHAQGIDGHGDSRFNSIMEWIRTNVHRGIDVAEVSREFGINPDYLSRKFKRCLGIGVKRYINGMRVERAKKLLCTTDMNIKTIAAECGFTDEKVFMKTFRRYENVTPTSYRDAFPRARKNAM